MKHGTIYISSRGLKKAEKYECSAFSPPGGWGYDNEYVSIKDYQATKMSMSELLDTLKIEEIHKL